MDRIHSEAHELTDAQASVEEDQCHSMVSMPDWTLSLECSKDPSTSSSLKKGMSR